MKAAPLKGGLLAVGLVLSVSAALGHGDVQPQPVDTAGLAPLGETWREENPIAATRRRSPSVIPGSTRTAPAATAFR